MEFWVKIALALLEGEKQRRESDREEKRGRVRAKTKGGDRSLAIM